MKAAVASWDQRIAPVFDVARRIRLLEVEGGRLVAEAAEPLGGLTPVEKALRLAELGVDLLVCGAISRPIQVMVEAYGIRVVPFVTGDVSGITTALIQGRLSQALRSMPGGRGFGRGRCRGGIGIGGSEETMRRGERTGDAGGPRAQGRRQGRNARHEAGGGSRGGLRDGGQGGRGRMSGGQARGPDGRCVCPACGYEEKHERGAPCTQKRCPECGSALIRR